jgi:hypothetical protein
VPLTSILDIDARIILRELPSHHRQPRGSHMVLCFGSKIDTDHLDYEAQLKRLQDTTQRFVPLMNRLDNRYACSGKDASTCSSLSA